MRDLPFGLREHIATSIQIAIEPGKVRTGDFDPNPVTFQEHIAGGRHNDPKLVYFARLQKLYFVQPLSMPGAQNAFREVDGTAIGVHVDKFRREVRVARRGSGV